MRPTPEDFAFSRLVAYAAFQWPGYRPARHHRLIARDLEAVERGEVPRLIITMPPRHGKSMLASEFFPSWYLGRNPSHYVIASTYAQDLADDFGRKVRDQIADASFRAIFPGCALRGDSKSSKRFHITQDLPDAFSTEQDGAYFAAGIGGPLTGRGAHLLLIDDPVKNRQEAESPAVRQTVKDWYTSTAYTRLMPEGRIVVIQTRWHDDDLAGWLLREHAHEGWKVLSLPAVAEVDDDPIGRKRGEPLWDHYSLESLERIKRSIGSRDWTALYQQRPAPAEGGIFKPGWLRRFREPKEKYKRIVQSWDTAYKPGQLNDPSCCTTWGEHETGHDLLHVLVKRLEYPDLKNTLIRHAAEWNPDAILVEDKASGQSLLQDVRRETALPLIAIQPQGDKETRASAVSALVEAGKVATPEHAAWLTEFETELMTFPNAANDDQVDSLSQYLQWTKAGASTEFRIRGL